MRESATATAAATLATGCCCCCCHCCCCCCCCWLEIYDTWRCQLSEFGATINRQVNRLSNYSRPSSVATLDSVVECRLPAIDRRDLQSDSCGNSSRFTSCSSSSCTVPQIYCLPNELIIRSIKTHKIELVSYLSLTLLFSPPPSHSISLSLSPSLSLYLSLTSSLFAAKAKLLSKPRSFSRESPSKLTSLV